MICTFMLMICIIHLTSACAASNGCVKAARVTIRESFILFCVVCKYVASLSQVYFNFVEMWICSILFFMS